MPRNYPEPLGGHAPKEVRLKDAPLERVIAQVRYPVILKIEEKTAVSAFQEAIAGNYPILRETQNQVLQIQMGGPQGAFAAVPSFNRAWQFEDTKGEWKLVLSRDALTIETSAYQSRTDLLDRWSAALQALHGAFHPPLVERVGMRYVDRIQGEQYAIFDSMVNPELLGRSIVSFKSFLRHSLAETILEVEEGEMLLRWGVLAPQFSPDPTTIAPLPNHSFLIDIDVSSTSRRDFDVSALSEAFRGLAERAYSVFRFAVTDQFLEVFGSER